MDTAKQQLEQLQDKVQRQREAKQRQMTMVWKRSENFGNYVFFDFEAEVNTFDSSKIYYEAKGTCLYLRI